MINLHGKLREHIELIDNVVDLVPNIESVAKAMVDAIQRGGKIIWMGNGGSAADAQHFAAELVGRFQLERSPIASLALTTDSSILTAIANDYSFNEVFSRQIEALCGENDVVVGISTSGNSENIVRAVNAAKSKSAYTIGLLGKDGGKLKEMVDLAIVVSSNVTSRIQEAHGLIGHMLCEYVECAVCDGG